MVCLLNSSLLHEAMTACMINWSRLWGINYCIFPHRHFHSLVELIKHLTQLIDNLLSGSTECKFACSPILWYFLGIMIHYGVIPSLVAVWTHLTESIGIGAHISQDNQYVFLTLIGQILSSGESDSRRDDSLNSANREEIGNWSVVNLPTKYLCTVYTWTRTCKGSLHNLTN